MHRRGGAGCIPILPRARSGWARHTSRKRPKACCSITRGCFSAPIISSPSPMARSGWKATTALMGESTMAVQELYAEGGFEIDEDFRELPDHIAVELEFLYLLIYDENEARRNGDAAALAEILALRRRFLDAHLGRWVGPFTAAVASRRAKQFLPRACRAHRPFRQIGCLRVAEFRRCVRPGSPRTATAACPSRAGGRRSRA